MRRRDNQLGLLPPSLQGRPDDEGASLVIVMAVFLVVSLLFASVFTYLERSSASVRFETGHTQALYNARMGVDLAVELLKQDASADSFSNPGMDQLQSTVEGALSAAENSGSPFTTRVTLSQLNQKTTGKTVTSASMVAAIQSVGKILGASVTLNLSAPMQYEAPSKSNGSGSNHSQGSPDVTITAGDSSPIGCISTTGSNRACEVSGDGGIQVSDKSGRASVTVPAVTSLTTVSTHQIVFSSPSSNVWVKGDNAVLGEFVLDPDNAMTKITGATIVTGANDLLYSWIHGPLIVTGSAATLWAHVNGPAYLYGNDTHFTGTITCGAVIAGSNVNVTLLGPITGPMVVLGDNVTITSLFYPIQDLVIVGSSFKLIGHVSGTVSEWSGQPITVSDNCFGLARITSSGGGSGTGAGESGVSISVDFSSTRISG